MKASVGSHSSTVRSEPQRSRAVLLGALGLLVNWAAQAQAQSTVDLDAATARRIISAAVVEAEKGPPGTERR